MGSKQSKEKQLKGDFSFINDELSRDAFHNLYIAITKTNNWKWLKNFEPDKDKGFVFTQHKKLTEIENALDQSDPANRHSGASWARAVSSMSHIACFGWDDFVERWKKQNSPKSDVTPTKAGAGATGGAMQKEKNFCCGLETIGLVDPMKMDENNKKAWDVMKTGGMKEAVSFMFQHPTEKDNDDNPVKMDYGTMRSFYG